MKTIGPKGSHRHFTRKMTHTGYYTVGVAAVDEIVVYDITDFRFENKFTGHAIFGYRYERWRIIIPVYTVTFDTLIEVSIVLGISLFHTTLLAALIQFAVLKHTDTVYSLVRFYRECLLYLIRITVRTGMTRRESIFAFSHQEIAF